MAYVQYSTRSDIRLFNLKCLFRRLLIIAWLITIHTTLGCTKVNITLLKLQEYESAISTLPAAKVHAYISMGFYLMVYTVRSIACLGVNQENVLFRA